MKRRKFPTTTRRHRNLRHPMTVYCRVVTYYLLLYFEFWIVGNNFASKFPRASAILVYGLSCLSSVFWEKSYHFLRYLINAIISTTPSINDILFIWIKNNTRTFQKVHERWYISVYDGQWQFVYMDREEARNFTNLTPSINVVIPMVQRVDSISKNGTILILSKCKNAEVLVAVGFKWLDDKSFIWKRRINWCRWGKCPRF